MEQPVNSLVTVTSGCVEIKERMRCVIFFNIIEIYHMHFNLLSKTSCF